MPTPPRQVPGYALEPVPPPDFVAPADDPASWIHPVPGRPLEFRTTGQQRDVTLVPFYTLFDERYGLYWRVTRTASRG